MVLRQSLRCASTATVLATVCLTASAVSQDWWGRGLPPPPARADFAMACDSVSGTVVMFGGRDVNGLRLADTWVFDGLEWRGVSTPVTPPARQLHAMVFDPLRGRVVLFGGNGTLGMLADTWEYDVAQGTWAEVTTARSPTLRHAHGMAYDAGLDRVVLWGGQGPSGYLTDTWTYDGTDWTPVAAPASPTPRVGFAMAYDPARGRTVLFGGSYLLTRYDDTWEFDGATWVRVPILQAPPGRVYHAMVTDTARGVIVLFGGVGTSALADTWVYDGTGPTWRPLSPGTSPPALNRHAMAFDPRLGQVVLFGGQSSAISADTWLFDGTAWRQTAATVMPPWRVMSAFGYDPFSGHMLALCGNTASGGLLTDAWELDGSNWSRIQTPHTPTAAARNFGYDSRRACFVGFGGRDGPTLYDETWEFDCRTRDWRQVLTAHAPTPRVGPRMAYDARRGRMVLFGGGTMTNGAWHTFDDTWEYDGQDWMEIGTAHRPSPRMADLVYDTGRGKVVLFGGQDLDSAGWPIAVGDTWEYDGSDWTRIPIREPAARTPNIAYDPVRGRTLVFGGFTGSGGVFNPLDDMWEYDGTAWTELNVRSRPPALMGATMAHDPVRDRMLLLFGMRSQTVAYRGVWELLPPAVPTFTRYGLGCEGSNGVPLLDAVQGSAPALGGTLALEVTNLPRVMGVLALGFGFDIGAFAGLPLPLDLGTVGIRDCDLWIGLVPDLTMLVGHLGNSLQLTFSIPNDPLLAGQRLAMQAIVFDAAAPNGCASVSNAGIAKIH